MNNKSVVNGCYRQHSLYTNYHLQQLLLYLTDIAWQKLTTKKSIHFQDLIDLKHSHPWFKRRVTFCTKDEKKNQWFFGSQWSFFLDCNDFKMVLFETIQDLNTCIIMKRFCCVRVFSENNFFYYNESSFLDYYGFSFIFTKRF